MPKAVYLRAVSGKGTPDAVTQSSTTGSGNRPAPKTKGNTKSKKPLKKGKGGNKKKSTEEKPRKYLKVAQQMRMLQRSTNTVITKASFQRLIRGAVEKHKSVIRFTPGSLSALQEAAEAYAVGIFSDAHLFARHASRITVMRKDIVLVRQVRGLVGSVEVEKH
eukprot:TRINITY_DN581_c0_g2_i1.p1 TRINITY_DN581_c0_g2~~TRINITY_DN581_c0_g2_i1.p1  ORF type:complete len:184 (+),score=41.02 TRINITY_DN581_c0_g2_i1:65-553(+)